ncbi:hypothetical protein [Dysgonomonas sp. 511]|uniref:hypothetical protein n=1 Tax=Dysgonomonas sp. 511 TaxID=2302930 RepID=UPI0013D06743|nr:hypothetical protein [Dysgonomonas sp. 511]NDV79884.1 hypothetical protein [Dysgonomonas sp. 511]
MDTGRLGSIIDGQTDLRILDIPALEKMAGKCPYFQAIIFTYLKALYMFDYSKFEEELRRKSIFVGDRKALYYYILSEEYNAYFQKTGKEEISSDKTSLLLDAFFESQAGSAGVQTFEYDLISTGLLATDYVSYLESNDKETEVQQASAPLKHQDIIDSFISKSEQEGGLAITLEPEGETADRYEEEQEIEEEDTPAGDINEDLFFTETLAKIYIKQKKYEKAYKIIKHLSLNYPKKNIYFADQLSFLEKLIINTKFKDTK